MIILGLGSNLGDRLHHLRRAYLAIKNTPEFKVMAVSPLYHSDALLPASAETNWQQSFLNFAISIESRLSPEACLEKIKQIECDLGRKKAARWSPRVIDIDILIWHEKIIHQENLIIPHPGLLERPFALWPLADLAPLWIFPDQEKNKTAAMLAEKWGSRFSGEAPFHTRQIAHSIDHPILMGIINVTPDSFSDGKNFLQKENAIQHAQYLIESGAEILDLGAESTAPNALPITHEEEWARLSPVLSSLLEIKNDFLIAPKISIDTRHPQTAQLALELGVDWINDVSGLTHPDMRKIVAQFACDTVIMHHLSIPSRKDKILNRSCDPVPVVYEWAEKQIDFLKNEGITKDKIIFDPGIGFGKTAEQSLLLLKNVHVFKNLGVRLLIGHSRKSFMNLFSSALSKERDIETMVMTLLLAEKKIDYVRVHNVDYCARGLKTWAIGVRL